MHETLSPLALAGRASRGAGRRRHVLARLAMGVALLACAACGPRTEQPPLSSEGRLDGVTVRLVVVDDPALAAAIGELAGEWSASTGAQLVVSQARGSELLAVDDAEAALAPLEADALVYPVGWMGALAARERLLPIPDDVLSSSALAWPDLLELLAVQEATWGGKVWAVPLGTVLLTCYMRGDLVDALDAQPPYDWSSYDALAARLAAFNSSKEEGNGTAGTAAAEPRLAWSPSLEPLGPGWAALTLLARAAPYAKHPTHFSALFHYETMQPLVAGPPYIRALEELVAAYRRGAAEQLEMDPHDVRQAFWQGRCGLALTWPSAAAGHAYTSPLEPQSVRVVPLPGASQSYNTTRHEWEASAEQPLRRVPLLASEGRLASVLMQAEQPEAALRFFSFLCRGSWADDVMAASPATTLSRTSQVNQPGRWTEAMLSPGAAESYATNVAAQLEGLEALAALRLPGRERYLAVLDDAVRRACRDEIDPQTALEEVASAWSRITVELGSHEQKQAYRRSLGLPP